MRFVLFVAEDAATARADCNDAMAGHTVHERKEHTVDNLQFRRSGVADLRPDVQDFLVTGVRTDTVHVISVLYD